MRFFDRTEEIASLRKIREMAQDNAQFTVVTGRRRIGKTSLVWKAYEDEPILYFFVARKAEGDLCGVPFIILSSGIITALVRMRILKVSSSRRLLMWMMWIMWMLHWRRLVS